MIFTETELPGAFLVDLKRLEDERGFFARSFCKQEFTEHGLDPCVAQCNISFNRFKGTLRGMHFQMPPHAEAKLVRCTRGVLYDVIVDLRPASSTYLRWIAVELTAENRKALYVPQGLAHGFQTLEDETEVFYQMSEFFAPDFARGFHYADPDVGVSWPIPVNVISEKDRLLPYLSAVAAK
jgi:dTDP-4-dehydrorhamnose 3,5-epimerase